MTTCLVYETTVADHLAKLERFVQDSPVGRNFTWFAYFAIVGLAWLSAILFYVKQGHQNHGYLYSGTLALILTLTLPTLYRWYQNSFWASVFTPNAVQGLVGRKVLTIHEDFFEEVGAKVTLRVFCRNVVRVEQDPLRTWLILAPLIAVTIPAAAFKSPSDREAFTKECERCMASQARIAEQSVGHGAADNAV